MSDGWQVGDLALFVGGERKGYGEILPGNSAPEIGRIYPVERVIIHPLDGEAGLVIPGCYNSNPFGPAWAAFAFRKIRPDEHEPCEEEFVTLLKRNRVSA